MTDRQLMTAYADGRNVHAFGTFMERHESALISFAAAFLRDDGLAQNVVQEAFFKAARDPKRLLRRGEAGASERNWLLKVVRDLSVDVLRRRSVERKTIQRIKQTATRKSVTPDAELEKRNPNPPREKEAFGWSRTTS